MKLNTPMLAGTAAAMCAWSAAGDVVAPIYFTSFESPAYKLGGLVGQDLWKVLPESTPDGAAMVQAKSASGGALSVLFSGVGRGTTEWRREVVHQTTGALCIVDLSFSIMLPPGQEGGSWMITLYGDGGAALSSVQSWGGSMLYGWTSETPAVVPITAKLEPGTWGRVGVRLDFVAQTAKFTLDGAPFSPTGSLPAPL